MGQGVPLSVINTAAGFFSIIIVLLQCWLRLDRSQSKIPRRSSPRPRQDQVKMPQSPRRNGDLEKNALRAGPVWNNPTLLCLFLSARLMSAQRVRSSPSSSSWSKSSSSSYHVRPGSWSVWWVPHAATSKTLLPLFFFNIFFEGSSSSLLPGWVYLRRQTPALLPALPHGRNVSPPLCWNDIKERCRSRPGWGRSSKAPSGSSRL